MNHSIEFLNSIDLLQKQSIPLAVLIRARESLLDYLAVTCAGAKFQEEKLHNYFMFAEPEEGKFTAIGTKKNLVLKEAVFLNGLNGHALDFDDGTNSGIIHLGSPIFSLLIPLAEKYDVSIDDMLKAAIVGYEVSYTMAVSIQPGHKALGYHATGTCGVLGATIAASYMLGFTEEERFQAFAAACISATGMLKVLDDGSELKPYNVAKTSLLALISLQLAKAGFKGHPDPLGGERGYFKMMTGFEDVKMKPILLNDTYAIQKTYTKPYASCRYTHPSVEAAIHLRNKYDIKAEDVEEINIKTYSLAVAGHDHTQILGAYSAKMSIPYSTAVGLIYGKAGLQEFSEEKVRDKEILELTSKIFVTADERLSEIFPKVQSAIMEIKTKNGSVIERIDFPKGEPENPLTDEEFRERYDALMAFAGVDNEVSDKIFSTVYQTNATVRNIAKNI